MNFELILLGKIPSANKKRNEKFETNFRKQVHDQLGKLWECEPLANFERYRNPAVRTEGDGTGMCVYHQDNIAYISLINEFWGVAGKIDICFYEPNGGMSVVSDVSDVDNRVKILFDVLQIPKRGTVFEFDRQSIQYCLLENDIRVNSVSVKRQRLLREIGGQTYVTRIGVTLVPTRGQMNNLTIIGVTAH